MDIDKIDDKKIERIRERSPNCYIPDFMVSSLSEYFEITKTLVSAEKDYWFRGQGNTNWDLTPQGLRPESQSSRTNSLRTLDKFKRKAPLKLDRNPDNELGWVQLARHYGLPTRLLDWTENSAIALYFACQAHEEDGLVFLFDPFDLNIRVDPENPRIFDANRDQDKIEEYLNLTGIIRRDGNYKTVAINPVWNSERIIQQKGTFTLHGNRTKDFTQNEVSSLAAIPILSEYKKTILKDLEMIGVEEMSIFPEPEHTANYLKDKLDYDREE